LAGPDPPPHADGPLHAGWPAAALGVPDPGDRGGLAARPTVLHHPCMERSPGAGRDGRPRPVLGAGRPPASGVAGLAQAGRAGGPAAARAPPADTHWLAGQHLGPAPGPPVPDAGRPPLLQPGPRWGWPIRPGTAALRAVGPDPVRQHPARPARAHATQPVAAGAPA